MPTISERYKQAILDLEKLKEIGIRDYEEEDPDDFCGGFCNNDMYDLLLMNPTKKNALSQLEMLIAYYFNRGFCNSNGFDLRPVDIKDHEIYEIGKRYGII
jgi:hypothetical protein